MTYLRHWYFLLLVSLRLAMAFAQTWSRLRHDAFQDLGLRETDVLTSKEKKRFRHYCYGTTYLAVLFYARLGRRRTVQERYLFSNLAALACFFDDLVDASRNANEPDFLWRNNPEAYGQAVDPRGLSLHFLKNIYDNLPAEILPEFQTLLNRVFNTELYGLQQTIVAEPARDFAVEKERLAFLTAEKGGCSVLLFRRLLSHPMSAEEHAAWYEFGYLIQLCDDIFDLWHDRQAGTTTLATYLTERDQVAELQAVLERQVIVVANAFKRDKRECLIRLKFRQDGQDLQDFCLKRSKSCPSCLILSKKFPCETSSTHQVQTGIHFLVAITRVCLAHYMDLQKKHGTLPLDDRKAMVVDMDLWRHRIRTVRELLKTNQA